MTDQELITTSEIVKKYGVARKTITRWVKDGKITPVMTLSGPTGAHLFSAADAEEKFKDWKKAEESDEPADE